MGPLGDEWTWELPNEDMMIDDELGEPSEEMSPRRRRKSPESASSSSNMLRNIAVGEAQSVLVGNAIPDLMRKLDLRMDGLQRKNTDLVQTANGILKQAQQSICQIRDTQQIVNRQISQEK